MKALMFRLCFHSSICARLAKPSLLGLIIALAGCSTVTTDRRGKLIGVEVEKRFDSQPCLEAVAPMAHESLAFQAAIDQERTTDKFVRDEKRPSPVVIEAPQRFTYRYSAFDGRSLPVITLGYFKRRPTLVARVYAVSRRWVSGWSKRDIWRGTVEKFPAFQYPELLEGTGNDLPITFEVLELKDTAGALVRGTGRLNKAGQIELDLRPFIRAGAASPNGLTFLFHQPKNKLTCEVIVVREVFNRFQGELAP